MRVLIGCGRSGVVRRAFRALGHDAWSCDLQPADDGSEFHFQCDILTVLDRGWDLGVMHPECTYLCNSSVGCLTHIRANPSSGKLYGEPRWVALRAAKAIKSRVQTEGEIAEIITAEYREAVDALRTAIRRLEQLGSEDNGTCPATQQVRAALARLEGSRERV